MTHKGTFLYQAPEVSRGDRYDFSADVYSFALTMYELCDRVSLEASVHVSSSLLQSPPFQDLPYTSHERGKAIKLATDVATEGHRPELRSTWNVGVSFLITSCWCGVGSLRPSLALVISNLSLIMEGRSGLITSAAAAAAAASAGPAKEKTQADDPRFAPGALWRRVETRPALINKAEVIGGGSFSTVYKCTFQNQVAALKVFRNTSEESAYKEIEVMFSLR